MLLPVKTFHEVGEQGKIPHVKFNDWETYTQGEVLVTLFFSFASCLLTNAKVY